MAYLKQIFEQFGKVNRVYLQTVIPLASSSKYAFVTFEDPSSVTKAIKQNEKLAIGRSLLRIELSTGKDYSRNDWLNPESNGIVIKNLSKSTNKSDLHNLLNTFGSTTCITPLNRAPYSVSLLIFTGKRR